MAHRHLAGKFNDLFTLAGQEKADVLDEILWEIPYSTAGSRKVHRTRFGHTSRTVGGSSVRFPS